MILSWKKYKNDHILFVVFVKLSTKLSGKVKTKLAPKSRVVLLPLVSGPVPNAPVNLQRLSRGINFLLLGYGSTSCRVQHHYKLT